MKIYPLAAALCLLFAAPLFAAQNELHAKIESAARETLSAVPAQPPVIESSEIRAQAAKALEGVATPEQIEKISNTIKDFAPSAAIRGASYELTDIRYYKRVLVNTSVPGSYNEVGTFNDAVVVLWRGRVQEGRKTENRHYIRIYNLDGKKLSGRDDLSHVMLKDLANGKVFHRSW